MIFSKLRTQHAKWVAYKNALKEKNKTIYWIVDTVEVLAIALAMALLLRQFVIQVSVVPSPSMEPTLMVKDRLFVNRIVYTLSDPKRGDIVVFKSPFKDGKDFVKRLVGMPGDTLHIEDGNIFVNGKLLVLVGVNEARDESNLTPIVIPTGNYFLMGDNRANSYDSRFWGFVPREDVLGKAWFTFWPVMRMHLLK